jgi:hypothetical protein
MMLKEKSNYEVQIFGDRIDAAVNNYETDYLVIQDIFIKNGIEITDHRLKPVSLENVFINVLESES